MERTYLYTIMKEIQDKGLKLNISLDVLDEKLEWVNSNPYNLMIIYKSEILQLSYRPKNGIYFRIFLGSCFKATEITNNFIHEINLVSKILNNWNCKGNLITILSDEDIYKLMNR